MRIRVRNENTAGDVCAANNTKNSMKGYVFYVECPKSSTTPDEPPKCIKSNDFCNGVADCPGGTDEAPDRCLWHRLEQEQMQVLRSEIYQIMRSRERRKQKSHHYVRKNYSREDDDENDDVVVRHKKKKHRRSLRRILNLGDDNSSSLDSEYRRR
ncbi:hypothetical protein WR25_14569 [Diploscapter pachys]|uniref:Uncharacterized protein n=1 Tax=Diploscapter pachys TaxID=2018661 RepID=A0A2A2L4V8_9BILA|nr:hypothetical protein WR25_14569 [Diploscapter pachys]